MTRQDAIHILGAREHNLQDLDLSIPRNQLVVITGVSGSGKSSLAFDTLYAEGQRRHVESLSAYARQFLGVMEKPEIDHIEGLSPAIAIEQKTTSRNPRSTVGTITEVYDFLRLLWARAGTPHCPECGQAVEYQHVDQMVDIVKGWKRNAALEILAPLVRSRKGEFKDLFREVREEGFLKVWVDGTLHETESPPELEKQLEHDIAVVIDRLTLQPDQHQRLRESLQQGLQLGGDLVRVDEYPPDTDLGELGDNLPDKRQQHLFSQQYGCPDCEVNIPELEPRQFSFNSPYGACPVCDGLGVEARDEEENPDASPTCRSCAGDRLKATSRSVRVGDYTLPEMVHTSIKALEELVADLRRQVEDREDETARIARPILQEVKERLTFMNEVGLGYLTLDRPAGSLSGGEAQRIRLATQLGSRLTGVLYVLDEPSIGLHQRDQHKLLGTLEKLRDLGNTVIVVEHDEATIRAADWVVDLGPGAGRHGGRLMAEGTLEDIKEADDSLTGAYLRGEREIPVPARRRDGKGGQQIAVRGARHHNLKDLDVSFPLGKFICVTGVSGSGKSSLVEEILYRRIARELYEAKDHPGEHDEIAGLEHIDKVLDVDQSPIGRTPRSNPATYTSVFTPIRELFAGLPQAQVRGYEKGRFSFNVKGGRCEACQGRGHVKVEMHFLPDVYAPCDVCRGKRYNRETLEILYRGKSIADVLEMSVDQALEFFDAVPKIRRKLQTLKDVGLGYLHLGQPATTLSGGEAQRVKLSKELGRRDTGRTLYILDEPTTGLHAEDVRNLLQVLHRLVEAGNTVIIIEHHLGIIKTADWVIDLGPEGGKRGGWIVAEGTPEEVAQVKDSYTGQFLQEVL